MSIMLKKLSIFLLTFIFSGSLFSGLPITTKVFISRDKAVPVGDLENGSDILSFSISPTTKCSHVSLSFLFLNESRRSSSIRLYLIATESGHFYVNNDQVLYNARISSFVKVSDLTIKDQLLNFDLKPVAIKSIKLLDNVINFDTYYLTVLAFSSFFICDSNGGSVLAHNAIVVPLIIAAPAVIAKIQLIFTCATVGIQILSALGVFKKTGKWLGKLFGKKKKKTPSITEITIDETLFSQEDKTKIFDLKKKLDKDPTLESAQKQLLEILKKISKSSGGGNGGPPNYNDLFEKFKKYFANPNVFPHIFREDRGHFKEYSTSRLQLFLDTFQEKYLVYIDKHGKSTFKKVVDGVGEIWVRSYKGRITNAGVNNK
ncbi:hypothetical protein ACFLYH_01775 [Candidatus Dependentiae bacterium]